MTLGDRVAVLKDGSLQQVASPIEIYRRPANVFVAGFIGSPAMNFFEGRFRGGDGSMTFESPEFSLETGLPRVEVEIGAVVLGVRPQDIAIVDAAEADVMARVEVVELLGSELLVHLRLAGSEGLVVRAIVSEAAGVSEDETVGLRFGRDRLHLFDAGTGRRLN